MSTADYQVPPPSYDSISPPTYLPDSTNSAVLNIPVKGIPPGLECLTQVNQLLVQEKFVTSQGLGRAFNILNGSGQQIFQACEQVRCCRPMQDLAIQDLSGRNVMGLTQYCKCSCTEQMMEVNASPGNCIGYIGWMWNTFATHMLVKNINQEVVLHVLGPGMQTSIFGNVSFEIKSRDEQHVVGMIRNENETFIVSFPLDLDVTIKALLLATCYYLNSAIHQKRRETTNRFSSD
ncbi:phospholipid scramblase 3 [Bombina bombina]|uniref:phospholipid scramblase 3 n=1 Tax=Bombina bombina TaxID=8345 RepID=UPI00235A9637|nr:phospholipid scramblase 3 [Bombina bombina]